MALGRSKITKVQGLRADVQTQVNGTISDCWNTLQYVANGLESWAGETSIGTESMQNAKKLAECLNQMINAINTHMSQVDTFLTKQIQLNKD